MSDLTVLGRDVQVGDLLAGMGSSTPMLVTGIEPYDGPHVETLGEGTRRALLDGKDWGVLLPPACRFEAVALKDSGEAA